MPPRRSRRGAHRTLVLVTGFGSFEAVRANPSAEVARALELRPPAGVEVVAAILPVSFARVPRALDRALARLRPRVPEVVLGLGVMREPGYRVELRARPDSRGSVRVDVDGRASRDVRGRGGEPLWTPAERWLRAHVANADGLRVSQYAGGYVCERAYHHSLLRARPLGVPAVFLHVPPLRHAAVDEQIVVVRRFLAALSRAARAGELERATEL